MAKDTLPCYRGHEGEKRWQIQSRNAVILCFFLSFTPCHQHEPSYHDNLVWLDMIALATFWGTARQAVPLNETPRASLFSGRGGVGERVTKLYDMTARH